MNIIRIVTDWIWAPVCSVNDWTPLVSAVCVCYTISRPPVSFSTVPPIVNGGDWGRIVRDLETIIVWALLVFNFITQRSLHPQTLPRSRIRNFGTVTPTPGYGAAAMKRSHRHNQSAYFPEWKKGPRCTGGKIVGKTSNFPCGTPDSTLTCLLRQPSTIKRDVIGLIKTVSI